MKRQISNQEKAAGFQARRKVLSLLSGDLEAAARLELESAINDFRRDGIDDSQIYELLTVESLQEQQSADQHFTNRINYLGLVSRLLGSEEK